MDRVPICALATAPAPAALAVIRTSGPGIIERVAALTDREQIVARTPGGRVRTARLLERDAHETVGDRGARTIDEVVLTIWRAPSSYTGEDMVEISCHGSTVGVERILSLLVAAGITPAEPGEFTQRAFINGRIDLTRAEAVHELVTSRSTVGHELAINRLEGALFDALNGVRSELIGLAAVVAASVDYPDDESEGSDLDREVIASARERLTGLIASWSSGSLYRQGVTVVLAGATNAGKSSLFNALVRHDRAIISATPGTTRDYIEAQLEVSGVPVRLFDTAGLREAGEEIEGEGMRRSRELIEHADIVVEVVDGTNPRALDAAPGTPSAALRVWNKIDDPACAPAPTGSVGVSARTHTGIDTLLAALAEAIGSDRPPAAGAVVVESVRQRDLLSRANAALTNLEQGLDAGMPLDVVSVDLQEALGAIGELTGEVTSEDILDQVFGRFCMGK